LVYLAVIWYIFPSIGVLYQEKSVNNGEQAILLRGVFSKVLARYLA
jgi:hypothetical protein